jgi:hypothetical protein
MRSDIVRRVRWGNVALAFAVLAALAAVVVWPLVSAAPLGLPPDTARPLVAAERAGSTPAPGGRPAARRAPRAEKPRAARRTARRAEKRRAAQRPGSRGARRAPARREARRRAEKPRAARRPGSRGAKRAPAWRETRRRDGSAAPRRDDPVARPPVAAPAPRRAPARRDATGGEFGFEGFAGR